MPREDGFIKPDLEIDGLRATTIFIDDSQKERGRREGLHLALDSPNQRDISVPTRVKPLFAPIAKMA